ncbi:MAG: hypothetical protein VW274_02520 [Thalassolituus sp.]
MNLRFLFTTGLGFPLVLALTLLTGCATYSAGIQQAVTDVEQRNFTSAATRIQSALSPEGNDRLLYHLELGIVRHLEGNYEASNQLLEEAARISEALKKKSVSESLMVMMSNPRNGSYAGNTHEEMLIYYYKAQNYLAIAQGLPYGNARLDALEGARIESRRLLLRLQALRNNEGSYDQATSEKERTFAKVMKVFSVLSGNLVDSDELTYRDDALAHYMTGISFEMNGEYDNARISYLKAAESYEKGYAEQFRLGNGMGEQARFDTARMMQRSGFSRTDVQRFIEEHLTTAQQAEFNALDGKAQLIVFEHKGRVPDKKELNLQLSVNPGVRSLDLQPYFFEYTQEQLDWFYLLYADKLVYGLVADYLNATRNLRIDFFTKTMFLGPLYDTAESIGLTSAIGNSLRVTVPYYDPPKVYGSSLLTINNRSWELDMASSPQQMAIQEQMKNAGPEIRAALARASVKAIAAAAIGSQDSSGLLAFASKLAAQLTDAPDTRSWLLLPAEIRVRRLFIEPGDYTLNLESRLTGNRRQQSSDKVSLASGDIKLWTVRTFDAPATNAGLPATSQPETKTTQDKPRRNRSPDSTNTSESTTVAVAEDKPTRRLPTKD